jgi:phenylacetate-CoA ligase
VFESPKILAFNGILPMKSQKSGSLLSRLSAWEVLHLNKFLSLNIFDLSLRLNRFPIHKAHLALQEILQVSPQEFDTFNERRKSVIVKHHLQHNQLYKKLVGESFTGIINQLESGLPLDWSSLPVMTKADLQQPLDQRLSHGYTKATVYVNKTSGSGGHPFVFAKDRFCHALIWANIQRRFSWHGIDFNTSLQARFYGMPVDPIGVAKIRFKDFMSNRYRFSIFDLSDQALEKIVQKFSKSPFAFINGYTSSIVMLAKFLKKKNLVLTQVCPTLKVCVTTSEMLFEQDRELLTQWLGVPVVNEYGASELDIIAFEDPEGRWLVNAETLFVEILDDHGRTVPHGVEGRIVVTSLYNLAHPMIRYEVGDYGILDPSSTAQRPILEKLAGRTNDFALLPSGKKPAGMTFYSITKRLFGDNGNVGEFVIRQTKLDTFEIDYSSKMPLSDQEIKKIKHTLDEYLEPGLNYVFNRKDQLQRSKSGKLRQFISLINQP